MKTSNKYYRYRKQNIYIICTNINPPIYILKINIFFTLKKKDKMIHNIYYDKTNNY